MKPSENNHDKPASGHYRNIDQTKNEAAKRVRNKQAQQLRDSFRSGEIYSKRT